MAIDFKKYVNITSGVGGGASVRQRDLIGRIFTTNPLLPPRSFVEMTTLADVGTYFGFTSDEYKRAAFYFGFVSKSITAASKISFARHTPVAVAPRIYGSVGDQALATYTPITTGSFTLTMGGITQTISALNFSSDLSIAAVAARIQAAIRAANVAAVWASATVIYDATRKSFNLTGGATGPANIIVTAGTGGNDIAAQLGWLSPTTILAEGSAIEGIAQTLTASADASDNFGSFLFMATLTLDEVTQAAVWNTAQNVKFQFMVPILEINATTYFNALKDYSGVALTVTPIATEYDEMAPMILLAATDYTRRNSVKNYMFQELALTPKINTTSQSNALDAVRVNYYGQTQTAGQFRQFYQRGKLTGLSTAPVDMNTFANEQWLKDYCGSKILELLLILENVSANATGRAQLRTVLQDAVDLALFNGSISVGKILNTTQKLYITQITGDSLAWMQVQNIGYWLDVVMVQVTQPDSSVEFEARYTLLYSKDDTIRKVVGSHNLI